MVVSSLQNSIIVYIDGACSGNPGPGGWGVVIEYNNDRRELSGFETNTTNNRMELTAAVEALKSIEKGKKITIYTDSRYVKDGITSWIHQWKKRNWKNSKNQDVKNKDLWCVLSNVLAEHNVEWSWIKAHAGHQGNERADALARNAIVKSIYQRVK